MHCVSLVNEAHPALQRRKTQRLESEIEISVESDHNFYTGFSANLSDGGLFVATFRAHEVGDRVRVRFRLPGMDAAIEAKVEVQWLRPHDVASEVAPGFGGAFVEISDEGRAAVEHFVKGHAPLFYAD